MATPAFTQAIRAPARLVAGPGDFTADFPHGGTALGLVRDVRVTREEPSRKIITAGEYGGAVAEIVRGDGHWRLTFALRGFDPDAMTLLLETSTLGASGAPRIIEPTTAGLTYNEIALLVTPLDPTSPAVYIPRAIPVYADEVEIGYGDLTEWELLLSCWAGRDSNGQSIRIGRLGDL